MACDPSSVGRIEIECVEASLVGPETKRYAWSHDLPEQFHSLVLLKPCTDDGAQGVGAIWNAASYDYDRYTLEPLRHVLPI